MNYQKVPGSDKFVSAVETGLQNGEKHNKRSIEKLAGTYGIIDKTHIKELTELAIVKEARRLAHNPGVPHSRYLAIVDLYKNQVNLSHRTSQSILLQQYSTPAPIAYIAGVFCDIDNVYVIREYFEPSAGNGLLTIAGFPSSFWVNEISGTRNQNLQKQGFAKVTKQDGTKPFNEYYKKFDAVLTNPPFGTLDEGVMYETFRITSLEHLMALRALDCMKDEGRAAIIIGGHTTWDEQGRIQAGKQRIFFNYLYSRYNVVDVLNIDGQLYSRQGTAFDIRMILINGRKKYAEGNAPLKNELLSSIITSFDQLYHRVLDAKDSQAPRYSPQPAYEKYKSEKAKHKDEVLLIRGGAYYWIFDSDVERLMKKGYIESGEMNYDGRAIMIMRIKEEAGVFFMRKLIRDGFTTLVVDEMENMKSENTMKLLELEAQALELKLQLLKNNPGLGAIIPGNINHHIYKKYLEYRNLYKEYFKTIVVVKNSLTNHFETFDQDVERLVYMFSIPLTLFSIIKGKKVYGTAINEKKFAEIQNQLHLKGYAIAIIVDDSNPQTKGLGELIDITDYIDDDGDVRHDRMFEHYKRVKAEYPNKLILFETPGTYTTFEEDAEALARICNLRIIMSAGPEYSRSAAISKITRDVRFPLITNAGYEILLIENSKGTDPDELEAELQAWKQKLGKAHTENDLRDFEQWLNISGKQERTVYFFPNKGEETYTAWGIDAYIVSQCARMLTNKSILHNKDVYSGIAIKASDFKKHSKKLEKKGYHVLTIGESLGAIYEPASESCIKLDTQVPDSMAYETHEAMRQIKQEVGGDIDNFVRDRLNYPTKAALCKVLSAEQIDAVAMAIYNIEAREQGTIIGDQTGIGKGRIAASIIRYAVNRGLTPVFLTEKANLFSDIYRDLDAIGSGTLKPLIVNTRESKTDIKDSDGNIVYQAPPPAEQQSIFESRLIPSKYDFVLATYTQFNSAEKKPVKPSFLRAIAEGNIFIMDEAHNSSGSSNTGEFMQSIVRNTRGVVFLSATFAKRPDNLPIYALKTAIADCNMTRDNLVEAIMRGGVALQEVLSSQLVKEGQMIRRERSYEGIEVNYITLDEKAQEHRAIADNITEILRDIISFQTQYIDKEIKDLDKIAAAQNKEVEVREGTGKAGVDNTPYFSKVFNVINQMLFSLKAEAVAERAIQRLREGKKTVIAFASTMGSFIETMETDTGMPVGDGETIDGDFAEVLRRGLDGVMRYTERGIDGNPEYRHFNIIDLPPAAQMDYQRISEKIEAVATGITISPIDIVIRRIKQAGYTVAEVTGRKFELQFDKNGRKALVLARKRINTNDAFRMFNNNEVDVLMINQSGSTGASAHAIPTAKVPKDQVRQRVMIVLQAELDISTEVQKRGRINRTGQILKPIYDYVTSAIPAEKRLMMMLQKKLKSLDANTTSNQKQSSKILDVPDFLNKYGDKIAREYLADNPEVNKLLDDPLHLEESGSDSGSLSATEDAAMKVSGRVAVLSTQMQDDFYTDISERYNDYIEYLKQVGEYDLEVEAMNLDAEVISTRVMKMGKGTDSAFGDDSILETVKANVLKKPFSKSELENILNESLQGEDAKALQQQFFQEYTTQTENKLEELRQEVDQRYNQLVAEIPNERLIKKLEVGTKEWNDAIKERTEELEKARIAQHTKNENTFENRSAALKKSLNYFYIGRYVSYPVKTFGNDSEIVPAIFIGYLIDRKKKNPYAPSAIKLRFAIANSSKYIAIPASYSQDIMSIIGASIDLKEVDIPTLLNGWHNFIEKRSTDRSTRNIITGNLLQAFSDQRGKLVSYTTIDGQVKKGILLPEHWAADEQTKDDVVVPILKALSIVRSIVPGNHIVTNNGLSIFRTSHHYKLIVSASRSKGGDIYLDKDILPLVEGSNFEKTSDKMVAMLPENNISKLVEVLQNNHSCSITIQSYQLKDINKAAIRTSSRKKIEPPSPERATPGNNSMAKIRILELEAEALELQLKLLAA